MANGISSAAAKSTNAKSVGSGNAKSKGNNALYGCMGCLGFLVFIGIVVIVILNVMDSGSGTTAQTSTVNETIAEQSGTEANDQVEAAIVNAIGDRTNNDEPRIINLEVNDHMGTDYEGDKIVIATLHADDNLTAAYMNGGIQLDSIKLFPELFAMPDIAEVALLWQFETTDEYGNSSLSTLLKIDLTKQTANKINWDKFDRNNFKAVADSYWESPALR
ncbi:hypothetical protein PaecuDRAFT_0048 [Paenibacillus curdlanolyticus YK9]|uniref:Uncharacterized protein n=1 Tax=Paenibacillus curdlanolyticus YK9 TaxID=717606 RepID=E0I4K6_9BACL|nr:hypothetical protein [Paenibacillus curdlanolyticus]EFM12537.1 hypothetical protein PaecuDRAFT_0048 [Paenibacillus curdlanolyticus YK9]